LRSDAPDNFEFTNSGINYLHTLNVTVGSPP
jgi:hypothetical protein